MQILDLEERSGGESVQVLALDSGGLIICLDYGDQYHVFRVFFIYIQRTYLCTIII